VVLNGWTPNDAQLTQYKAYTFNASATDPNIGGSITEFDWNFGDGTTKVTPVVLANGKATSSCTYSYTTSGTPTLSVVAKDAAGLLSNPATASVTVTAATSPLSVAFTQPAGPVAINPALGSTSTTPVTFQVQVTNVGTGTVSASGIKLIPGDSSATQAAPIDLGNGAFSIDVTYPAAAAVGTRTATPTVTVVDSNGVSSAPATGPAITINTVVLATLPPTIAITAPATPSTTALTSKSVTLSFTLTDQYNNPVSYTVDWGVAGTSPCQPKSVSGITTTSTSAGANVSLTHIYPDTFTGSATVTVNATDSASSSPNAATQTRTIQVSLNQPPTATITSPQASSVLPSLALIQDGGQGKPVIPVGSSNPDVVVLPANGMLVFQGTGTAPTSGGNLTYHWTFPGGVPSSSSQQNPGQVVFPGVTGQIVAYLVNLTVTDATDVQDPTTCTTTGRTSATTPKTTQKWVVVDGVNTQNFNLSFMYRQKSDNNGTAALTAVQTAANGLGALVQIFQDGANNTYAVRDAQGINATVSIPVRSDLPFYIEIPAFGGDSNGYMMRIPNAPTGSYADLSLGTTLDATSTVSNFGFQNSSAPLNPTLNIVTAQGFTAENAVTNLRTINGTVSLLGGTAPANQRWLSRLSVPVSDTLTAAIPSAWSWSSNTTATVTGGFSAYQAFADWPIVMKTLATSDTTTPGASGDLEFKLDYETYKTSSAVSKSFAASMMQAFRAPKGVTSPYDLDNAGWGRTSAISNLNPTQVDISVPGFYQTAAFSPVGTSTLAGGLQGLSIPYDPTDTADRVVLAAPVSRDFSPIVRLFGYSEYLWTKVWSWPLVLNSALLNSPDTEGLGSYANFRFSDPLHTVPTASHWPSVLGISSTDTSSFNLNANGGSDFDPSGSPVTDTISPAPSDKATGHFYWTVFSPFYSSAGASIIARTWLAQGTADTHPGQPPTTFSGNLTDATAAFGFVPPQDAVVDKRTRKADGTIDYSVSTLNGYRVNWFNPTKDASGNSVAPDFWVVELNVGGTKSDFMLPGNFPAAYPASTVDPATMPILTDARTTLVHPTDSTPLSGKTVVAPGYCWFDVPPELRPATGTATTTLTVYAVKSVLSNHAPAGARPLNRPEWIEAIKTASAAISLKTNSSQDLSNAYKIPFNYYWDIVITNGPITTVAQ
jgi:hypothetical protein